LVGNALKFGLFVLKTFVLKENYYQHDSKLKAVVMYKTIDNNDDAKRNNNKAML